MNRQKAIKRIIRKLKRVIWLKLGTNGHPWAVKDAEFEQSQLEAMIREAVMHPWEP